MDAGFADEARALLDAARKQESPHENVAHAMVSLSQRYVDEDKNWQANLAYGAREQLFLSSVADAMSAPNSHDVRAFEGVWLDPDGNELNLIIDATFARGEFEKDFQNTRITITPYGRAGFCEFERLGSFVIGERSNKGFALLGAPAETLEVLYIEERVPVVRRWTRKNVLALPSKPGN